MISVKDELPEIGKWVVTKCPSNYFRVLKLQWATTIGSGKSSKTWFDQSGGCVIQPVITHWQKIDY